MQFTRRDDGGAFTAPTSGDVQAEAARSVYLLNAIETAVTRASANATILNTMALEMESARESLGKIAPTSLLDPEGRASGLLRQAAATAERIHMDAQRRGASARADSRLTSDDGVEAAFAAYAAAAASVHEAIESYRDHLETLDALQSPRGDHVYGDAEDMIDEILAGR